MRPAPTILAPLCTFILSLLLLAGCGGHTPSPGGELCARDYPIVLSIHQGNRQTARPGTTLAPLYVRLRCTTVTQNMPPTLQTVDITDEDIAWRVTSGGGTLSASSTKTNVDGFASTTWTLGPDLGPASIEASYARAGANRNETISVHFDATTAYPTACGESGGVDRGAFVTLDVDTTWRAADNPNRAGTVVLGAGVRLTIEPGAVVCVQQIESPHDGGVVAEGTAQSPILFSVDDPATQSWHGLAAHSLRHVTIENADNVRFVPGIVPVIEDSTFVRRVPANPLGCSQINLFATSGTGRMLRSTVDGYGSPNCAAVHAAAALNASMQVQARITRSVGDGILLGGSGTVSLFDCSIHGSGGHGVFVFAPGTPPSNPTRVSINGCNLGPNAGDGVFSQATNSVDATGNWWGDAGGPFGGDADGLTGMIDAGAWLEVQAVPGY